MAGKHFILTNGEETHVTTSRDGYRGWTLLGTAARPPADDEVWDAASGSWKLHSARRAARERAAKAMDPHHLLDRIEKLEARVAAFEGRTTRG